MAMRAIVTDADGKPLEGRAVHVELQKMTYVSATQEDEGGENADQSIKYDTVATADVTPGTTPVTVQLTPGDPGAYRVIANFAGAKSDASATNIQVFAFGGGEADWGLSDPNAVAVKLDKQQYAIGDTASALIASPYAKADVYLAVVRNDTIYRTTLRGVQRRRARERSKSRRRCCPTQPCKPSWCGARRPRRIRPKRWPSPGSRGSTWTWRNGT